MPLLAFVLCFAVGWVVSSRQDPVYRASTTLVFSATKEFDPLNQNQSYDSTLFVSNQVQILTSGQILTAAQRAVDPTGPAPNVEDLRQRVTAEATREGSVIRLSATARSPQEAAALVNAVSGAYSGSVRATVTSLVQDMANSGVSGGFLDEVRSKAALYGDGLSIREEATPPETPVGPQVLRDATFLGLAGLFAALTAIVGLALFRRRLVEADDIAAAFDAPVLVDTRGRHSRARLAATVESLTYDDRGRHMLYMVCAAGRPGRARTVCRSLVDDLAQRGIPAALVEPADLGGPEGTESARRRARLTLVPIADPAEDPRGLSLARFGDGLLVLAGPAVNGSVAKDLQTRAAAYHVPIVGVLIDSLSSGPSRRERPAPGRPTADAERFPGDPGTVSGRESGDLGRSDGLSEATKQRVGSRRGLADRYRDDPVGPNTDHDRP